MTIRRSLPSNTGALLIDGCPWFQYIPILHQTLPCQLQVFMKIADVQSRCHGTRRAQSRPAMTCMATISAGARRLWLWKRLPELAGELVGVKEGHWLPWTGSGMDVICVVVESVDPKKGQWYACWVSMHGCLRMCIVYDIINDMLRYISCVQCSVVVFFISICHMKTTLQTRVRAHGASTI